MLAMLMEKEMALKTVVRAVSDKLLLGRCLPCLHETASKIQVPVLELDEYILMYFKKEKIFYAYDPQKICKAGDMVLIRKLPKKISTIVTHEVIEIAYALGDVTDPITGEKCVGRKTRSVMEKEAEMYGKWINAFNYSKAPKRGWQEGKRDFSDKDVYVKYHEFSEEDEEFNDPYTV